MMKHFALLAFLPSIVFAQTSPTQAETERFIIDNYPRCNSRNTGEVNESIEIVGQRIAMKRSQGRGPTGRDYARMYVVTVYLTKVKIEEARGGYATGGVIFECDEDEVGCSSSTFVAGKDNESVELSCEGERGDRLFKAFRHLQSFTGGPPKPKPSLFR
jgi:hypothetical protein